MKKKPNTLPNMIQDRYDHSSVTIANKLFVIGGNKKMCSKVYDSISRKFSLFSFRLPCAPVRYLKCETVSFNNKIVVFCGCSNRNSSKICVYNVDEQKWSKKETVLEYNFNEAEFHKAPK